MITEQWLHLLGGMLVVVLARGAIVCAAALLVTAGVRRLASEARHTVWLVALASFVLVPLAWLVLPPVRIGIGVPVAALSASRVAAAPLLPRSEYAGFVDSAIVQAQVGRLAQPQRLRTFLHAMVGTWAAGCLVLATRLLLGHRLVHRMTGGAARHPRLQRIADSLASQMRMRHPVPVLTSARCNVPFACGLARPRILLPAGAADWAQPRLTAVFAHELAHVKRRDVLAQSAGYAVCLLFWFLPLPWLAYAALLREAETCCDRQVLARGIGAPQFARDLVDLSRTWNGHVLLPCTSSTIRRKSMLKERIGVLLSLRPDRRTARRHRSLGVAAICMACLVPVLAVTCTSRPVALRPAEPLYGTWVLYDSTAPASSSVPFVAVRAGRDVSFSGVPTLPPGGELKAVVEERWVDTDGNEWYKGRLPGAPGSPGAPASQLYWMIKVEVCNTKMSYIDSPTGYPPRMDPRSDRYRYFERKF